MAVASRDDNHKTVLIALSTDDIAIVELYADAITHRLYTDASVSSLPAITGTVTANAGTNLNTSALSTSAKQDTLLTELQLKADLTETQPVSLASLPALATGVNSVGTVQPGNTQNTTAWYVEHQFSFSNIATNATTVVKSGAGLFHVLTINTRGTGSTATVYDNTAGSGTKIATIDTTLSTTAFLYDVKFTTGLTVVTAGAGAADVTVSYR